MTRVGGDVPVTEIAHPAHQGSVWSLIAPISATVCGLGLLTFSSLSLLAAPTALLAIVAGMLGVMRDRRTVWRVVAGLSALATLALVAVTAIVIYLLSAGGRTT
jgi:hypothetical protein